MTRCYNNSQSLQRLQPFAPGVPEWCKDLISSETSSLVELYLIENIEELPDATATRSIIL
jgi:hypothetical protein